ncbi:hypothetical protein [Roseobacter weihaiensis]|uniref:hypothetical protein n=1 Tax=Roseobacter weihaiensis TaxID=2763262 RepID=UPI001D0BDFA8|nr:hypothetical protein [Roseobacter sp. H9]
MFERYQKAIAVLLAGIVSIAGLFVPALRDLPVEAFVALSSTLALVACYVVPNRVAGYNVDAIAAAILSAHGRASGELAVYVTDPKFKGPSRLVRLGAHSIHDRGLISVADLPPRVGEGDA